MERERRYVKSVGEMMGVEGVRGVCRSERTNAYDCRVAELGDTVTLIANLSS